MPSTIRSWIGSKKAYWGMAAFFTEIQTPGRPKMVYRVGVKDDPQISLRP